MDFSHLFTSFDGRINRQPYWIGILVMIAVVVAVSLLVGFIVGFQSPAYRVITLLVQLALLYPVAALMAKRLHDRNRPTWWVAFPLVPAILSGITNALGITGDPMNQNSLDYLLGVLMLAVGIWFLIELGFLRGTVGPNEYGPDPLERQLA